MAAEAGTAAGHSASTGAGRHEPRGRRRPVHRSSPGYPLRVDGERRRALGRGRHVHDGAAVGCRADQARRVRRLRVGERTRVRRRPAGGSRRPQLVLSAGDNAYLVAAPPVLNRLIFQPLQALLGEAPMVATLGEHDLAWRDGAAVISALHLPGHHYTVQYGPVQVVVLGLEADASARTYAAKTLGAAGRRARCGSSSSTARSPRPTTSSPSSAAVTSPRSSPDTCTATSARCGPACWSSSSAPAARARAAPQFTPATPGAQVSLLAYGFLRIDVNRDHVGYRFINDAGKVLDRTQEPVAATAHASGPAGAG